MERKATIIILLFLAAAISSAHAQIHQGGLIEWNEFYKLDWTDFQGNPTDGSMGDAGTVVRIKAKPYRTNKKIRYDVYAYFSRSKSWANETSSALLSHEQLHFDIAELFARKIRKKISDLEKRGVNDIKIYNSAIAKLLEESNEKDQLYDLETLHGALSKKQLVWEKNIEEELTSLERHKKRKQVIKAAN